MKEELAADCGIASQQVTAITFLILILSGFSALRCEARVYDSDGSEASVQACIRSAADGDIVTIPAGTFTWTSALNITKGITLQGQTTITGAGSANPLIKDLTIVLDDTPRSGRSAYILAARMARGSQSFRLTGITFAAGTKKAAPTLSNGPIRLHSDVENKLMRVDHCHFDRLYQGRCIWVSGWCYGVADHNVFQGRTGSGLGTTQVFLIQHTGNYAWADYPWYGTDKFFFIEDNTVSGFMCLTDSDLGGRFVVRHNYLINAIVTDHGTEGGTIRGVRCKEVYDNTFYWSKGGHPGGQRSGTCLWHDNTVIGPSAPSPSGVMCNFTNNRETYIRAHPGWGIADGTSVWDTNDTEGNGTFVEGHAPYLFQSGSASSSAAEGTLIDASKNWTTNQWKFYSVRNTNPASASYGLASYIISNTSTTITFANSGGNQGHLIFNAGDTYEIHRVLMMMDQNGGGKTDLITGSPLINTTTGTPSYAHSVVEPCYSWNNVYTPTGQVLGLRADAQQPTTKEGIDYFNLGNGFAANTTPSAVYYRYNAALNGVQYTGTFVYPHPLVTAQPFVAAQPTSTQCSLLQRRLDRLERRQQRLERRHRSNPRLRKRIHRLQLRLQRQHCP
jgi:hypothetical protein